ncbi:MAG: ABC transporter substrate-binding protein [Candidatus Rokubacteria bacterium]|nr:ABC transporter substrate-binding protein [Candidatus Rokubacteria bacterium]
MNRRRTLPALSLASLALAILAAVWLSIPAAAQGPTGPIKIGVLYDLTGPFAAAGAVPGSIGTKIAFDMINEKGGVRSTKPSGS